MLLDIQENLKPLSVSEINNLAKNVLENNFSNIFVMGEISKITVHSSGHWYFTIKDDNACIDCVMFSSFNKLCNTPSVGNRVLLMGKLTIYQNSGRYQLSVTNLEISDKLGMLQAKFNELYKKLNDEGVFNKNKILPKCIKSLAIITANNSAAMNDILRVYHNKKSYLIKLKFYDSLMQGENAAKSIINILDNISSNDYDLILIARGGGSKEDLFCFNDEKLVRKIADYNIPIITGLGHEVDVHLSDLAASKYYATPTAAMDAICYNKEDRELYLDELYDKFSKLIKTKIKLIEQDFLFMSSKFSKRDALNKINFFKNILINQEKAMKQRLDYYLLTNNKKINLLEIKAKLKNNILNKKNNLNLYSNYINKNNYYNRISLINGKLEQFNKIYNIKFSNTISDKKKILLKFENSKNTVEYKFKIFQNDLNNKKDLLNINFKRKIKEKYVTISNYYNILKTNKAFLESIKEYARLKKSNIGVQLKELKIGDEIELVSFDCVKTARIIKES